MLSRVFNRLKEKYGSQGRLMPGLFIGDSYVEYVWLDSQNASKLALVLPRCAFNSIIERAEMLGKAQSVTSGEYAVIAGEKPSDSEVSWLHLSGDRFKVRRVPVEVLVSFSKDGKFEPELNISCRN